MVSKDVHSRKVMPGFTMVELIITVGLISLLALTITAVSLNSLIGSTRIRTLTGIRQSGDYAISQIQRLVRNARSVTCTPTQIITVNPDGGRSTLTFSATNIASTSGTNPAINLLPNNQYTLTTTLTCTPSSTAPTLVETRFLLRRAGQGTQVSENASIQFESAIQVRSSR